MSLSAARIRITEPKQQPNSGMVEFWDRQAVNVAAVVVKKAEGAGENGSSGLSGHCLDCLDCLKWHSSNLEGQFRNGLPAPDQR